MTRSPLGSWNVSIGICIMVKCTPEVLYGTGGNVPGSSARLAPQFMQCGERRYRRSPHCIGRSDMSGRGRGTEHITHVADDNCSRIERAQSWLDGLPVADDDERQMIGIHVLTRDTLDVGLSDGSNVLDGRRVEVERNAVSDEWKHLAGNVAIRLEVLGQTELEISLRLRQLV